MSAEENTMGQTVGPEPTEGGRVGAPAGEPFGFGELARLIRAGVLALQAEERRLNGAAASFQTGQEPQ
jgi:hypothetical protein